MSHHCGAVCFFTLIQPRDGPDRQRALSRDAEAELAGAAKDRSAVAACGIRDCLRRQVARAIYDDGCAGTLELVAAAVTPKHSDRGYLVA